MTATLFGFDSVGASLRTRRDGGRTGRISRTSRGSSTIKTIDELDGSESPDDAIPILVKEQGGRLLALGQRFCGSPEEAEDLVQETFLNAYRGWKDFDGRSSAATWLYAIASRVCQRLHRKRAGEPERIESLEELLPFGDGSLGCVPRAGDDPLSTSILSEEKERLEAAIAGLPVAFRMPFVLKELVGFSLAEIAAILGMEESTVKTRVHRARLKVRKALAEVLPQRELPAPAFSREVCLDLLRAKQESLDRGVPFEFPRSTVCERCSEIFATMDRGQELCTALSDATLPENFERELLESLQPEH